VNGPTRISNLCKYETSKKEKQHVYVVLSYYFGRLQQSFSTRKPYQANVRITEIDNDNKGAFVAANRMI
jgi:hypothetical protein